MMDDKSRVVSSLVVVWVVVVSMTASGLKTSVHAAADEAHNVRLVGYHDMQGRQALQVTTKSDSANGNWVYVGHVPNTRTREATLNPITGNSEWNGTSILEISDPAHPKLVWHIPNDVSANSRSVSVVYDYEFDADPPGRDYLIRNSEAGDDMKFQIFDISSRATNPSQISLVAEITGTPENSCGSGCAGDTSTALTKDGGLLRPASTMLPHTSRVSARH